MLLVFFSNACYLIKFQLMLTFIEVSEKNEYKWATMCEKVIKKAKRWDNYKLIAWNHIFKNRQDDFLMWFSSKTSWLQFFFRKSIYWKKNMKLTPQYGPGLGNCIVIMYDLWLVLYKKRINVATPLYNPSTRWVKMI